jgi:hypothetical protein
MTPAQARFVELEKKKAEVKKFYEELSAATEAVVAEIGVDKYFTDEEGTVYKTVVPEGRFVTFDRYGIDRTKRPGEARGTLSLKEAEAAGFTVPKG